MVLVSVLWQYHFQELQWYPNNIRSMHVVHIRFTSHLYNYNLQRFAEDWTPLIKFGVYSLSQNVCLFVKKNALLQSAVAPKWYARHPKCYIHSQIILYVIYFMRYVYVTVHRKRVPVQFIAILREGCLTFTHFKLVYIPSFCIRAMQV